MTAELSNSQESLPLSQETFQAVWDGIPNNLQELLIHQLGNAAFSGFLSDSQESYVDSAPVTSVPLVLKPIEETHYSSLPNIGDNPGILNFKVTVPSQNDVSKESPFVYSSLLKRLFVKKDAACPFNFSASSSELLCNGFSVRAMVYFRNPEHINDTVIRCINHMHSDKKIGIAYAEHLLQNVSVEAKYYEDINSKRCSVVVPFENPALGQDFSTYLYKFVCYTSCSGGPNRRPMCVVFTLENKNLIMGRCKIDLKVCSCPLRDRNLEEKKFLQKNTLDSPISTKSSLFDITNEPEHRETLKRKHDKVSRDDKVFIIKEGDEECYKFLKGMQKGYHLMKHFQPRNNSNWTPTRQDIANILSALTSSSESEDK